MRNYSFNNNIIEIDPRHLEEGIRVAEEERFESISIKAFVGELCIIYTKDYKEKSFRDILNI